MTSKSKMGNPTEITGEQISQVENRSLRIGCYIYLVMGIAGLLTWQLSGSGAPKLDGIVCLVSLATGLVASWVGAQALRKPTEEYPYGRFANESIYIMFRGLMLLGIVVLTLVGSVGTMIAYFVTREGVMVDFKVLVIYSVLMVIPCIGLHQIHKKNNRKIGNKSEVLKVEDTAAVLSAILSGAIGVAFVIFGLIPDGTWITSDTFNIKFIADSIVVLILCILILSTPWTMFKTEIQRIVGKRVDRDIEDEIRSALQSRLEERGLTDQYQINDVYAIRLGKNVMVDVRLAYAGNKPVAELDALRARLQEGLKELFESVHSYLGFSGLRIHEAGQPADPDAPAPST